MSGTRFAILLIFGILLCKPVMSQTLHSCRSIASDADGDGYGWENNNSCVITSTSLISPTFTNLETGNTVNLTRAQWSPSDFVDHDITCSSFQFDGTYYRRDGVDHPLYDFEPLSQTVPYNGNVIIHQNPMTTETWTLENGIYYGPSELALSPWVQIVDLKRLDLWTNSIDTLNAVRIWHTNNRFTRCFTTDPYAKFVPTGSALQNGASSTTTDNNNCDYSNAGIHDGWGWNPLYGTSCPPVDNAVVSNCDYSNAAVHNGWGWDPIARQSCEPQDSSEILDVKR